LSGSPLLQEAIWSIASLEGRRLVLADTRCDTTSPSCPCQRSLRSPGPREDLRRCRSRDALTATHAPPSHVTLLGPMPAFMVVLINFGYRRRLSRLHRMNEAAIANNRNRRKTRCALRLAPKQSPPSIAPKGQTKLSISLDDFGALKFWFRIRTSPRPSDAKRVWEAGMVLEVPCTRHQRGVATIGPHAERSEIKIGVTSHPIRRYLLHR
jgi:hypothetical protein